ncbi:MAG: orotate phosphoribosyltransferase [Planctomycetes bacterium]|jgi:hypothetical protein|nr:orotate phosphoribosyltransferase [Planctomycetota bacterium]MDP6128171.1 DUF4870 domain-containing protein [Planctomycetota bacterium]MDP7245345.1 DUF4870 domain-containing protein [Planctomycetota bacterium]MDP7559014.1 DUF4870 domain-containing protein [Planctomycetota bacterium]|tara:strand:+ start:16599 stop:17069 length:471 start_codon:yes stop_codon:yes gene_type:complete
MNDSKKQPYSEAPDPFQADGPDGSHVSPELPNDIPPPPQMPSSENTPPPASVSTEKSDEVLWATLCHLSALLSSFLGPLIIWILVRDKYPLVDRQGREALNFQITLYLYALVLAVSVIGIPFLIFLPFYGFIMVIIAAMRVNSGETYRFPLTLRIL